MGDNANGAKRTADLSALQKREMIKILPEFQSLSQDQKEMATRVLIRYCFHHKTALLIVYGTKFEKAFVETEFPNVSGDRYGLGEGDLDVNNLLGAAFKVFNKQGEFETLCAGKDFLFWMSQMYPNELVVPLIGILGNRQYVVYEAACLLLVMFPRITDFLYQ